MTIIGLLTILLPLSTIGESSIFDNHKRHECQPIEIPLCEDIPYKFTYYPNMFGHLDQQSVIPQTEHFKPLVRTKCSPHIQFFLCSVFAPMCPQTMPQALTSCRSVCEEVKRDCVSILEEFGIGWPEPLNCSKFPESPQLCMKPTDTYKSWTSVGKAKSSFRQQSVEEFPEKSWKKCPSDLVDLEPGNDEGICAIPCTNDVMFEGKDKKFAELWMIIWASVCLVVTAFTVLTFVLDRERFRFPERSIFYLSACYHFHSWAYLARVLLSYEQTACESLRNSDAIYLTTGGLDNPRCVLAFIIVHYFSSASLLWWLILTVTWYLSSGRKWVPEGIDAYSSYFHFLAWGLPALSSIAVLVMHKVDASELTGLCSVGNSDPLSLLGFVILPRSVSVLVGCCFVLAGFLSMRTVRDRLRLQGTDTSRLDKLMVKIGIFTVLYVLPAVVVLICDCYHTWLLFQWRSVTTECKSNTSIDDCRRPVDKPRVELYMLNVFMSLIVGTTTGMWVAGRKTCATWQKTLCCGMLAFPGAKPPQTTYVTSQPLMNANQPRFVPDLTLHMNDRGSYSRTRTAYQETSRVV